MPRSYRPYTAGGDPADPTSLLTPSININQVNFQAQTQVAQPENQWETLQNILGLAAGAFTQAVNYKTNTIQNEMAVSAAIERAKNKEEAEQKERIRDIKSEVREHQDSIINSYDARITAALLQEQFDKAESLGQEFSGLYPAQDNPYMATKAQDQLLRIKNTKKIWDNEQRIAGARESAAVQGIAIDRALGSLERLNAEFSNPETRINVTSMFPENTVEVNGQVVPAVPDDQLHTRVLNYLLGEVPPEMSELLSPEDRIQLSTNLLRMSDGLRNNILQERNKQRTYRRIEMRIGAALTTSLNIKTPEDLQLVFSEFDNITSDRENGFITQTQQNKLEANLVTAIGQNAGREVPIAGALGVIDAVRAGVETGAIPLDRGTRVVDLLRRRAVRELQEKISGIKTELASVPEGDPNTALATAFPTDPSIDIGLRLGVYEQDAQGNMTVVAGNEPLANELDRFSKEYNKQKEDYEKKKGVIGNIETVNNTRVVNAELNALENTPAFTPEFRQGRRDDILLREFYSSLSYAADPTKQEQFTITAARIVKQELDAMQQGPMEMSAEDAVVRDQFMALMQDNDINGARKVLAEFTGKYYQSEQRTPSQRNALYTMMNMFFDKTMTPFQKRMMEDPTAQTSIDLMDKDDLTSVATDFANNFYKDYKKLNALQRGLEEDRIVNVISASDTFPENWFKYIGETYFAEGASETDLQRGFSLLARTSKQFFDEQGQPINRPSIGNVQMEIAMRTADPVVYDTLAIAEGLSLGTNQDPQFFLREAHTIVIRRVNELKATTDRMAKQRGELLPTPPMDYKTGMEMPVGEFTLVNQRREVMRQAFADAFGTQIGRLANNDPYFSIDAEDYNRMNALFLGFKSRGYSDDLAVRASVGAMKKLGYSIIVEDQDAALTGARVNLVFDPYQIVISKSERESPMFKSYLYDTVNNDPALKQTNTTINPNDQRNRFYLIQNVDLTNPNATIPYVIIRPNGERLESGTYGISARGFRAYQQRQAEASRKMIEEQRRKERFQPKI